MDERVQNSLSKWVGISISQKKEPFILQASERRTDEPYNRLVIHRNPEFEGIFATCIPRIYDKLESVLKHLTSFELFSSFGMNEVKNLFTEDESKVLGQGFGYILTSFDKFTPIKHTYNIQLSEILIDNINSIFPRRFICNIESTEASFAEVYIRDNSGLVAINVETKTEFRDKGIGCAVVSDATQWILQNKYAVYYGANINNIPSLHIAKKLGFQLTSQHIVA